MPANPFSDSASDQSSDRKNQLPSIWLLPIPNFFACHPLLTIAVNYGDHLFQKIKPSPSAMPDISFPTLHSSSNRPWRSSVILWLTHFFTRCHGLWMFFSLGFPHFHPSMFCHIPFLSVFQYFHFFFQPFVFFSLSWVLMVLALPCQDFLYLFLDCFCHLFTPNVTCESSVVFLS